MILHNIGRSWSGLFNHNEEKNMQYKHTDEELKYLQGLSLEEKIGITKLRITEFYQHYDGNVYVSFSGGKDSTVLLHIAREVYPDIKGVYVDTGLEFPEVKQHVKSLDNIDIIRPSMTFKQVLDEYGFVYPSKETAKKNILCKKGFTMGNKQFAWLKGRWYMLKILTKIQKMELSRRRAI